METLENRSEYLVLEYKKSENLDLMLPPKTRNMYNQFEYVCCD